MIRGAYDAFFRRWGYRLAEAARGRRTFALLDELRAFDAMRPEERQAAQGGLLAEAVRSASQSPFYRSRFGRMGSDAEKLATRRGLRRLPILTKEDIRRDPEALISTRATRKPHTTRTAGSTGQPLRAYADPASSAITQAVMAYCRSWWGIEPGARALNLWGHSKYLAGTLRDRLRLAGRRAADAAMNRRVFPAYDLSDRRLAAFVALVQRQRPACLVGYATALYAAARVAARLRASTPSVRAVVSTAEVLHDWQEEAIEAAFRAPVVQEYGLCETGIVAYSCPEGRTHVLDSCVYVEILDDEGLPVQPGETGRIVVTLLRRHTVPMLRYDTGDLAEEVEGTCPCGRPHRLIGRVQGRQYDLIRTPAGTPVPGVTFTHAMKYLSAVSRYQVVQTQRDRVDIFYEARCALPDEDLQAARGRIENALSSPKGAALRIRFERVDHLDSEASGKFRWIRSELPSSHIEARAAP